jgi:hypothetical protein
MKKLGKCLSFPRCLGAACAISQRRTVNDAGNGNDGLDPSCIRATIPKIPGHQLLQLQAGLRARPPTSQERSPSNTRAMSEHALLPCYASLHIQPRPVVEGADGATLGPICVDAPRRRLSKASLQVLRDPNRIIRERKLCFSISWKTSKIRCSIKVRFDRIRSCSKLFRFARSLSGAWSSPTIRRLPPKIAAVAAALPRVRGD